MGQGDDPVRRPRLADERRDRHHGPQRVEDAAGLAARGAAHRALVPARRLPAHGRAAWLGRGLAARDHVRARHPDAGHGGLRRRHRGGLEQARRRPRADAVRPRGAPARRAGRGLCGGVAELLRLAAARLPARRTLRAARSRRPRRPRVRALRAHALLRALLGRAALRRAAAPRQPAQHRRAAAGLDGCRGVARRLRHPRRVPNLARASRAGRGRAW
mmetsp:Transcript_43875/g.105469  ORF Transcript_43875/g.105469 Transcript_43875/m.105469 type:complete len:217 (-) Transcript_43875:75-725(-)